MTETLPQDDAAHRVGSFLDRLSPGHTGSSDIEALVAEAQLSVPWPALHLALLERVEHLDTARDRMALVLHASDPDVAEAAAGKRGLDGVFEVLVAAADAIGLDLYLTRAVDLLETSPRLRDDLPSVERLIEISDQIAADHEDTADMLVSLAQRVEDLIEADADVETKAPAPDAAGA